MASVFSRFRSPSEASNPDPTLSDAPPPLFTGPPLIAIPEDQQSQHGQTFPRGTGSRNPSNSPPRGNRARSRSPSATRRASSFGAPRGAPPPFPTPFHSFKLNAVSTKNQVTALKLIDRIDSLLFLGHTGATVLEAIPACMVGAESQQWYQRIQTNQHKPTTIEDFRARLITDHVWAFEQNRIMSRYQSHNAQIAGRRDPYLDSAEFKLHLGYIRENVKLEESLAHREKKLASVQAEILSLQGRETQFQVTIANLQNDLILQQGGQPVPAQQRTNDLINNMHQMEEGKLRISSLEQEKSTLQQHISNIQMQLQDLETRNRSLQAAADNAKPVTARAVELDNKIMQLQSTEATLRAKIAALTAANLELQAKASSGLPPPVSTSSPPPVAQLEFELQQMRQHQQYLITELTARDKTIVDMEAEITKLKSANPGSPAQGTPYPMGPMDATASMDAAFSNMNVSNASLEALIHQKDDTIFELHSKLGHLTDEAINRIQRVFQVEQSLLDSQSLSRSKDTHIYTLEARLQALGHRRDCDCGVCSATSNAPSVAASTTASSVISDNFSHRTASWASSNTSNSNSNSSTTGGQATPRTNTNPAPITSSMININSIAPINSSHPRFLDIQFKYQNLHPSFLPSAVQAQTAQLLENGVTVMHPGVEFKMLWETIARGLLETLSGDAAVLGQLTTHMKLCFREMPGESLKGLVVADVWGEVWKDVGGLDVVCDF